MNSRLSFTIAAWFCLSWLTFTQPCRGADDYKLGSDSMQQDGVPRGTVTKHSWTNSTIFPGTERDYWI